MSLFSKIVALLDRLSWEAVLLLVATLGLLPFLPEPHIWAKLKMIGTGAEWRLIDVFDLVLHGSPWVLAIAKGVRELLRSD